MTDSLRDASTSLREFALGLPGAYEDHPWGETVAKVDKKVFVFFGREAELDTQLIFSVKLPDSGRYALMQVSPSRPAMAWARAAGSRSVSVQRETRRPTCFSIGSRRATAPSRRRSAWLGWKL